MRKKGNDSGQNNCSMQDCTKPLLHNLPAVNTNLGCQTLMSSCITTFIPSRHIYTSKYCKLLGYFD